MPRMPASRTRNSAKKYSSRCWGVALSCGLGGMADILRQRFCLCRGFPATMRPLPARATSRSAAPLPGAQGAPFRRQGMNFHEYQAKQLFAEAGIPVPPGRVARTASEAAEAAKAMGGNHWVVKAQIHAG